MGQFSFMYAHVDESTKYLNLHEGDLVKMLIPKEYVNELPEFEKGYVEGIYNGYGDLCILNDSGSDYAVRYDMYTILALINNGFLLEHLTSLPTCDEYLNNRLRFIGLMNFDLCTYPLKIVPSHVNVTYENVDKTSEQDKSQGCAFIKNPNYKKGEK